MFGRCVTTSASSDSARISLRACASRGRNVVDGRMVISCRLSGLYRSRSRAPGGRAESPPGSVPASAAAGSCVTAGGCRRRRYRISDRLLDRRFGSAGVWAGAGRPVRRCDVPAAGAAGGADGTTVAAVPEYRPEARKPRAGPEAPRRQARDPARRRAGDGCRRARGSPRGSPAPRAAPARARVSRLVELPGLEQRASERDAGREVRRDVAGGRPGRSRSPPRNGRPAGIPPPAPRRRSTPGPAGPGASAPRCADCPPCGRFYNRRHAP